MIEGKKLPAVSGTKVLTRDSVTISDNLKWNKHVDECNKKANTCIYFIVLLKRARVPVNNIINFYCSTIKPISGCYAPVFHYAPPSYLSDAIERVQMRVLAIISPHTSYQDSLVSFDLTTLKPGPHYDISI